MQLLATKCVVGVFGVVIVSYIPTHADKNVFSYGYKHRVFI